MICNYELPLNNGKDAGKIPRLHLRNKEEVDKAFPQFYQEFLVANQPCIITADQVQDWGAMREWITSSGGINFDFLLDKYGNVKVPVTEITDKMTMEYGGGMDNCSTMQFKTYVEYWTNKDKKESQCLYLKDWHILRNCGNATERPYETLELFASDWLNETCTDDDFCFAYMGPAGSWTPLHADVYGSFSWSVNIIGRKRWHLYPPGKENILFRSPSSSSNQIVYRPENPGREGQDYIQVIQEAGETIFVPSGWYHVVWNETDVISINHNWFNASNICYIWHQLQQALNLVKKEMEGYNNSNSLCDDEEYLKQCQCQLILKANHGMDYSDFCEIIIKIWNKRKLHQDQNGDASFDLCTLDMNSVKHLINDHLLQDPDLELALKTRLQQLQDAIMQN